MADRYFEVNKINVRYGDIQVLWDIEFTADKGEIVALVGSNGAGKSTTVKSCAGLIRPFQGNIRLDGHDLTGAACRPFIDYGVILVPEGRQLFPSMTIYENLEMGASSKAAKAAVAEMVRQTGAAVFAPEEHAGSLADDTTDFDPVEAGWLMKRGTIVRHLLLPGCTEDSKAVIRYLYETYGNTVYISIMNQFTPLAGLERYPELNRRVTDEEYEEVVDYALGLGVECGFIQEGDTAEESFIPEFDGEGV